MSDPDFQYFEKFTNFERRSAAENPEEYRLDRMRALLASFGNPEKSFKSIHIAGSKGKGSTTHFCAHVLDTLGLKVALYTSPHLVDYRERISLPGRFFPDPVYARSIEQIKDFVESHDWEEGRPTTFELLTLCAFLIFRDQRIEWAVVETGLGGRLDATNLILPAACIITHIELEHTEILGNSYEEIAFEKAGIFKPGALLFSTVQRPEVEKVFREAASRVGGSVTIVPPPLMAAVHARRPSGLQFETSFGGSPLKISLATEGAFQAGNAMLAAEAVFELFRPHRREEEIFDAITKGLSKTRIRGRLEWFRNERGSRVMLDVAHTPDSVALALSTFAPGPEDILLFASVLGKRHDEMAALLAPAFGQIIITTPGTFRPSAPEQVYESFSRRNSGVRLLADPGDALDAALRMLESTRTARLLVCGSFYLSGIVDPIIRKRGYSSRFQGGF